MCHHHHNRINVRYLQFYRPKKPYNELHLKHASESAMLSLNGREFHASGALKKNASFSLHVLVRGTIRLYCVYLLQGCSLTSDSLCNESVQQGLDYVDI